MATRGHSSDKNLVDLLLADHRQAKALLAKTHGIDDLSELFCEVVQELVAHEVAEEEIVYPAFRRAGGSEQVADREIGEQQQAEELLKRMEQMKPTTTVFKESMRTLESAVLSHAESEEREVFPKLRSLDEGELRKLGKAYEMAKKLAPTHPHPHVPDTPPGNLVIGPIVAIIDRARDAARSALSKAR